MFNENSKKYFFLVLAASASWCLYNQVIRASEEARSVQDIVTTTTQEWDAWEEFAEAISQCNFEKVKEMYFSLSPSKQNEVVKHIDSYSLTALIYAIQSERDEKCTDIVMFLINRGAELDTQNRHGDAALHYAVRMKNIPVLRTLLDHGAEVNAQNAVRLTPLDIALSAQNREIAKLLVEAGGKKGEDL